MHTPFKVSTAMLILPPRTVPLFALVILQNTLNSGSGFLETAFNRLGENYLEASSWPREEAIDSLMEQDCVSTDIVGD